MNKLMLSICIAMLGFLLIDVNTINGNSGTKKMRGAFPQTIEIEYSDPHCDCLFEDHLYLMDVETGETVYFLDDKNYINVYYTLESEVPQSEEDGYGSATYRLKDEYVDRAYGITYKKDLCPGYKSCKQGKIYKNIIISIK
jgi:hypothetical protein